MSRIMENDRRAEASQEEPKQWTSREVLDLLAADGVLGDCLNEQSRRSWEDCSLQETLGFVFGQLLEVFEENPELGHDDPELYLVGLGILEMPA